MTQVLDSGSRNRRSPASIAYVILLLVGLTIFAACGNGTPTNSSSSAKGGNIVVGLISDPQTLDPLTSATLYDTDVMGNMYDTLFRYDAQSVLHPDLVSSYTYTTPTDLKLTLHTGITFQDGTPFNADAVIFNIERFLNDKASPRYSDVSVISALQKISDSQVEITLKKAYAPLLDKFTGQIGMMLSPTAVKKLGTSLPNAPVNVGSGPFQFVEWAKGDHLLLKANPHYWQKDAQGKQLPYLQSVRFRPITDPSVMYSNLQTNDIQIASNLNPNDVAQVQADKTLTYKQTAGPGFESLQINTSVSPFTNVHVRRALAWGINRQEIVSLALKNTASISQGPLSPASWAYDKSFVGFGYDPTKAKAELAQAGMPDGFSFTLKITSGNATQLQIAQLIQSELQASNIKMSINQETFNALVTDFETFHYQVLMIGWTGGVDPDSTMYSMFTGSGGFNFTKYANPQLDSFLNQGRSTTEQSQRIPFYQQAQKVLVEDASRVFLYHPDVYQATTSKVQNYPLLASAAISLVNVYISS